jgi:hypothetical protein
MKKNLLLFLFIIIVFFVLQHKSAPLVPMPAHYESIGQGMQIEARLGVPQGTGEVWTLAKKNDTTYIINVYNKSRLVHSFFTVKSLASDTTGTTYGAGGNILFEGTPYMAKSIHINKSGQTGSILFMPVSPEGNHTNSANKSN